MKRAKNRIGIKDIAKKAGVSIGTVDRVLHNRGEVKEATREKVMQIVQELGYTPNLHAKTLSSKRTYRLAAFIPDPNVLPYWNSPKQGLEKGMAEIKTFNGIVDIYTINTLDPENFGVKFEKALKTKPDGLIIAPVSKNEMDEYLLRCREEKIPYVFIDGNLDDKNCLGYFGQNARQSGRAAAKLMRFGLGTNAKVLVVNVTDNKAINPHLLEREAGFREYLKMLDEKTDILRVDIDLSSPQSVQRTLEGVFLQQPDINGVFVLNSRVYKVAEFLEDTGRESLALIGYDLLEKSKKQLNNGTIDFLICQKPVEQGFRSVLALFNYLSLRKEIKRMNYSPIDIVMKENVSDYNTQRK